MEVTGTIQEIFPLETGETKTGKQWQKQSFLLKTDEQYNNLYCFGVFGDKVGKLSNVAVGENVTVAFNVETREYNGKYYTNLSAWKIYADSKEEVQETDGLPF